MVRFSTGKHVSAFKNEYASEYRKADAQKKILPEITYCPSGVKAASVAMLRDGSKLKLHFCKLTDKSELVKISERL
jgi:hypothetical protein